jgi:hypothetical protein
MSPRRTASRTLSPSGLSGRSTSNRRPRCSSRSRKLPERVRPNTWDGLWFRRARTSLSSTPAKAPWADLLAEAAEVVGLDVVDGGVAVQRASPGVDVLHVNVDRARLGRGVFAHAGPSRSEVAGAIRRASS